MGYVFVLLLSLALCVDSFMVAVGIGVTESSRTWRSLRLSLFTGLCHTVLLVGGFAATGSVGKYIGGGLHIVSISVFGLLGIKMIAEGLMRNSHEHDSKEGVLSLCRSVVLSIATSVDAFMIGGALVAMNLELGCGGVWQDVVITALIVGVMACVVTYIGLLVGKVIGKLMGRLVFFVGGSMLLAVAVKILLENISNQ